MSAIGQATAETLLMDMSLPCSTLYIMRDAYSAAVGRMAAAQCDTLNGANYQICCIALNKAQILTPAQLDQCPPWTSAAVQSLTSQPDQNEHDRPFDDRTNGSIGGGGDHHGGGDDHHGGGGDDHHGGGDDHHEADHEHGGK